MAEVLIPSWHDAYELWLANDQKNAPLFSLPDGRFHTTINRRKDQASGDIIGRAGLAAVFAFYEDRPHCFEWTGNRIWFNAGKSPIANDSYTILDQNDAIRVANSIPLSFCEANELGEGSPWGMPFQAPQKTWFYQERQRMYQAAGRPYRSYGTYGGFENYNGDIWLNRAGGSMGLPNSDALPFKGFIRTVEGARSSCEYFARFESLGVGALIKEYPDMPDYACMYYPKKFAAEVMGKGMGRTGGIGPGHLGYIAWTNIEGVGGGYNELLHNTFTAERIKPNGTVVTTPLSHPQVSFITMEAHMFIIGFCLSDGALPFDETVLHGTDPNGDDFPYDPQNWKNAGFVAAYRYSQCDRTEGQPWQQCRYRFEGSETWIEPMADGTTTLEHASAFTGPYGTGRRGRPDAMFRVKGNALDFWAYDPSQGKAKSDSIIFQPVPNKEYKFTLRGQTLRQFRETI